MRIVLFDTPYRLHLFPFTETRAVADMLSGILTIRQKWERHSGKDCDVLSESYLTPNKALDDVDTLYINAHVFVTPSIAKDVLSLPVHSVLWQQDQLIAFRSDKKISYPIVADTIKELKSYTLSQNANILMYPWQLVAWNADAIKEDFELLTNGRKSAILSSTNKVIHREQVFVEPGADIDFCMINATKGPVYIGKDTTIMEGTMIRGPFALLHNATLKMGTCVYGATTIGAHCIAGGEIKNVILMNYSNKAHHGYLGDAVIGEWCNLGAGTSCSNIKNNAGDIKLYSPLLNEWLVAGQKCGAMMGDFSRTAIHTALNTGTVIGTCSNVVCNALTNKYIASFTWNTNTGDKYDLTKAISDIEAWMKLKNCTLSQVKKDILSHLYNQHYS